MSHNRQMSPKPLRLKVISTQHCIFLEVVNFSFENDMQHSDILKKYNQPIFFTI